LDVRSTQVAAIGRYDSLGFIRWAENPYYARVDGAWVAGYHYHKVLDQEGDG
jgi:ribosomal protein S18 acetylase RimI-like enzyme